MRLASVVMHRTDDLVALAMPTLERLRELTGETASLHCLLGNERICVAELVSPEPIRMQSDVGRTYPIHAGAAGKAILAWHPDGSSASGCGSVRSRPSTITDAAKLERELERIRQRGYAESESEVVAGAAVARGARARRAATACSLRSTSPARRCAGTAPSAPGIATPSSPRSPRLTSLTAAASPSRIGAER